MGIGSSNLTGYRLYTLLESTAVAATTDHAAVTGLGIYGSGLFMLNVTALATALGDKADVFLQMSPDEGTTWTDFAHFTQLDGNGSAAKYIFRWCESGQTPDVDISVVQDGAIAEDAIDQGPIGDRLRVHSKITTVDTPSFTYAVTALLLER
jgi:hypothetical protein